MSAVPPNPQVHRTWRPHVLDGYDLSDKQLKGLSYAVVDEIESDIVLMTLTPWPVADEEGRLRFLKLEDSTEVAFARRELEQELFSRRSKRKLRVGDVFAFTLTEKPASAETTDVLHHSLRELTTGVAYDMSSEARKVAKLALYAVTAAPIEADEASDHGLMELADTRSQPAPVHVLGKEEEQDD